MTCPSHNFMQKRTRAAWRRAADELLIDAIFGSTARVIRDADISRVRPETDVRLEMALAIATARPIQGLL